MICLKWGVIERSESPYASPLVLVNKLDNTYRVCVNFKELNKTTVFDPEPKTSPDDIFQNWLAVKFTLHLISVRALWDPHAR